MKVQCQLLVWRLLRLGAPLSVGALNPCTTSADTAKP